MYAYLVVATICVGYEFGFLQYCFGIAASIIYAPYFFSREKRISKTASLLSMIVIATYMVLRAWTFNHDPIYKSDETIPFNKEAVIEFPKNLLVHSEKAADLLSEQYGDINYKWSITIG